VFNCLSVISGGSKSFDGVCEGATIILAVLSKSVSMLLASLPSVVRNSL